MDFIVFIHGNVKYTITIDPTVWIFDERKIDLNTWEGEEKRQEKEWEAYKKSVSEQFDKELTKGVDAPASSQTNEVRSKKEQLIHGTFGIPFGSFIQNAVPNDSAVRAVIETSGGDEYEAALEDALRMVAGFSENGEPLKESGPIHLYYGDGSNKGNPVTHVTGIRIE
ncbi:hypothetical protein [Salibacterium halotolerans]|uniref:Peptidyl-prolyl cis-trans isomerase n=1 Tax=Salibacterium halotolerans TaxID=1884432 RepID=A0A1I5M163_9BACI|nr:hypothetical protein [Salibacterium halotolerans]SFP03190.1 hypothetical protein SAMN05518683_10249 [Salibacterium halotolerans]